MVCFCRRWWDDNLDAFVFRTTGVKHPLSRNRLPDEIWTGVKNGELLKAMKRLDYCKRLDVARWASRWQQKTKYLSTEA